MMARFRFSVIAGLAVGLMPLLSGCETMDKLNAEINALKVVMSGGTSPLAKQSPAPAQETQEQFSSKAAQQAKINSELLHEMFQVVLMREPKDRGEFGDLVDSMNQGASLEGIYNGFTHSSAYRRLEAANAGGSPEALKIFSEELAMIEAELPERTEFAANAAQPLPMPVDPGADPAARSAGVITFDKRPSPSPVADARGAQGVKVSVQSLQEAYAKNFAGASIYTIKRTLGDEALKLVQAKAANKQLLADWYSKWVVRMCSKNVNFGIPQRNTPDEQFHKTWAIAASEDQLRWEVLNRVHRLLNEANQQKK